MNNLVVLQKARGFLDPRFPFVEILPPAQINEIGDGVVPEEAVLVAVASFNWLLRGVLAITDTSVSWIEFSVLKNPGKRWGPFCIPNWQTIN